MHQQQGLLSQSLTSCGARNKEKNSVEFDYVFVHPTEKERSRITYTEAGTATEDSQRERYKVLAIAILTILKLVAFRATFR